MLIPDERKERENPSNDQPTLTFKLLTIVNEVRSMTKESFVVLWLFFVGMRRIER